MIKFNDKNGSLEYVKTVILPILLYSSIAGTVVGVVVSLFNYAGSRLGYYSAVCYDFFRENPVYIPLLFIGLISLAVVMNFLLHWIPEVKGSGIPRTEGVLRGLMNFKWYRIMAGTLVGSFISFFAGVPLGSEGPSVQLGAVSAEGVSETMREKYAWRRYISTGGAAAGLAVAFKAPVTGIVFVLEEIHKQFNPLLLLSAMTAVSVATGVSDAVALLWGGDINANYLGFASGLMPIPMNLSWVLLLIGVAIGLIATAFNLLLLQIGKLKIAKKTPRLVKLLAVFVLTGVAGLLLADSLGSGIGLIEKLVTLDFAWHVVLILLLVKIVMVVLAFDSGATGGLFVPMLVVGALCGALFAKFAIHFSWIDTSYYNTVVLVTMAAFLGAVIRAPITAIILLVEATGAASGFLTSGIEIFVAFIVAEVLMRRPLYDVLLDRELREKYNGKKLSNKSLDVVVGDGAFVVGKAVREIMWPVQCVVHSLVRSDVEIPVDGRTRLVAGDILHIQASLYEEDEVRAELAELCETKI